MWWNELDCAMITAPALASRSEDPASLRLASMTEAAFEWSTTLMDFLAKQNRKNRIFNICVCLPPERDDSS